MYMCIYMLAHIHTHVQVSKDYIHIRKTLRLTSNMYSSERHVWGSGIYVFYIVLNTGFPAERKLDCYII